MDPISLIGFGAGLIGGFGKLFGRGAANRKMRQLEASDPVYKYNPEVASRLALAKTLLNARMPGATSIERNIYGSGVNAFARAQKTATSGAQLLAEGGDIQGRTNQAFNQLGVEEAQDYQRRYGNLAGAQEADIAEQNRVFEDQVRRFQDKAQIEGAINANQQANWGDISNLGFSLADFGLSGGFNKMFGGGKTSTSYDRSGAPPFWGTNNPLTSFSQLQGGYSPIYNINR